MYCLDANVWIYYLDRTLPEHDSVSPAVDALLEDEPLFITTVLQMEVVHYLSTQLADSSESVDRFLSLEDVRVVDLTSRDVETAAELLADYPNAGIGGRDATVIAAMDRSDVSRLWTHDEGISRLATELDWLEVTDPVTADG